MAGNLLDALKHAGLADAKKAKKIENEKKQQQHRDLKRDAAHTQASSVPQPNTDHDFIAIEGKRPRPKIYAMLRGTMPRPMSPTDSNKSMRKRRCEMSLGEKNSTSKRATTSSNALA